MHSSTVALCLRAFAAGVDLACGTFRAVVIGVAEHLADRLDPPRDLYVGFDTRLDDLATSEPDGYLVETSGERA